MEKILAKVGNLTVTDTEIDSFLAELGQRGQAYNNEQGRKMILEQLIGNKLLLLDAKRNLFEAEAEFKAELANLKDRLLVNYAGNKVISTVTVSDKEANDYYEANKEKFVTGETVNASHILVDSEEKANDILAEINAGEISFEDAATKYSSCPSKQNGGNLGDFGRGQMVPEFENAAFAMEVGAVSAPVKTQFGYHIIKLVSKKESTQTPFAEVSEQIKGALLNEKRQKAYESKINQLKIMYPVDMM